MEPTVILTTYAEEVGYLLRQFHLQLITEEELARLQRMTGELKKFCKAVHHMIDARDTCMSIIEKKHKK